MNYTLRFHSIAEEEVAAIAQQYESDVKGVGFRFLNEIEHAVENVSRFPLMYQAVSPKLRRAVLRHFPYVIFYTVKDSEITVLGIRHAHQNPDSWPT